jgi:hypothetical protein
MAATYAGILGPLASSVVLLRSAKDGGAAESTIIASILGLLAFAAIGYIVGQLAHRAIEESVRQKFHAELVDVSSKKSADRQTSQAEES